jgi:FkbM family methyltransferase
MNFITPQRNSTIRVVLEVARMLLFPWFICIRTFFKKYVKYRGYNVIGKTFGSSLQPIIDYIKEYTTIKVDNVFEIGANFGQDAEYLMEAFKILPQSVYVFEAHPEICKVVEKIHRFNVYNYAVFNEEKEMIFHVVPLNSKNTGLSSVFVSNKTNQEVLVNSIRMDNFMDINEIDAIDFLKLDVEGASYEVLEGFGDKIKSIKALHVEAEHEEVWSDAHHLYDDIASLLINNGFELIYFQRVFSAQSDSFWIKKEYLK